MVSTWKQKNKIKNMDREDLLKVSTIKKDTSNDMGTCIVLDYKLQNREVERIIQKYWNVLKQDVQYTSKDVYQRNRKIFIGRRLILGTNWCIMLWTPPH